MSGATAGMSPGDHVCGLFADRAERDAVVAEFVADGLRGHDKVLLICDEAGMAESLRQVQRHGADVAAARASGQLEVSGKREAYLAGGRFEPEAILATLDAAKDAARAEGYRYLRATGDMTWALEGAPGVERLVEYEALLNRHVARSNLFGICQYDLSRFPAGTLLELLAVHPKAILAGELVDNFYFMPPEEFLGPARDDAMLRRWLANLADRRRADEARERAARVEARLRAERELAALRRRFLNQASHELRTPLTPMLVRLRVLALDPGLDPDQRRQVDGAEQGARRLAALAGDLLEAFRLEGEGDAFRPIPTDLAPLLEEAMAACGAEAERAHVHLRADLHPVQASVEPSRMRRALEHALRQAVAHARPGDTVGVELREDGADARVRLGVPPWPAPPGDDASRGGLDLPAYLCKLVLERHGGTAIPDPLAADLLRELRIPLANRGDRPARPAPRGAPRRPPTGLDAHLPGAAPMVDATPHRASPP
jgi:signal transduction histidine kinase